MTTTIQTTTLTNNAANALTLNSGDVLYVTSTGAIAYTGTGFFAGVYAATGNVTIFNSGLITGGWGIHIVGDNNAITNTSTGAILATNVDGIRIEGANNTVNNAGTINNSIYIYQGGNIINNSGSLFGLIQTSGDGNHITNSGSIEGVYNGVVLGGGTGNTLYNSGTISSQEAAVDLGGGGHIVNTGTIDGDMWFGSLDSILDNSGFIGGFVYALGTSHDVINNMGTIAGDVTLSAGDDVYNGTSGKVLGTVNGGAGNDVMTGGAAGDSLNGGDGNDTIRTGGDNDTLTGGLGADKLTSGGGDDIFVYNDKTESTGKTYDTVIKFDTGADLFDLNVGVSAIDATVASGSLNGGATFNTDLAAAVGAGQLAAHHAVLFTPTAGGLAGHTFLIVDANGTAGYQSAKDYVIELKHPVDLASLSVDNFV